MYYSAWTTFAVLIHFESKMQSVSLNTECSNQFPKVKVDISYSK